MRRCWACWVRFFSDYELLEEIARGAVGVVHKARQVSLNRDGPQNILAGQLASSEDVQRYTEAGSRGISRQHRLPI